MGGYDDYQWRVLEAEDAIRGGPPRPYAPTEHDTAMCPNEACGHLNRPGSDFCRYCGYDLPGAGSDVHLVMPGDDLVCPACGAMMPTDANVCSVCGVVISASAVWGQVQAGQVHGMSKPDQPTSSAGRQPMDEARDYAEWLAGTGEDPERDGTSPFDRAQYLASIAPGQSRDGLNSRVSTAPDLNSRITQAEELVAELEAAHADAMAELREAESEAPRFASSRTLTPAERTRWLRLDQAARVCSATSADLASAQSHLNQLLGEWDLW
jgi:hypothetical protein